MMEKQKYYLLMVFDGADNFIDYEVFLETELEKFRSEAQQGSRYMIVATTLASSFEEAEYKFLHRFEI